MNIKAKIISLLSASLESRLLEYRKGLHSLTESKKSDTKSSAGDKFETGREMIQIEMNKVQSQISKTELLLQDLSKLDPINKYESVSFGSLVKTNQGTYFISIGWGKVMVDDLALFVISLASPLGQMLNGKQVNSEFIFQGNIYIIEELN